MRQLTSLDAQFLALENARQTGHVGSLAMLDPSTAPDGIFGRDQVTRLIDERAAQLPPLRWRLAEVPFGLDHPYWVEEAEIDLGYHVREMALAVARAPTSSSPTRSRGSCRGRWTARARCGRST